MRREELINRPLKTGKRSMKSEIEDLEKEVTTLRKRVSVLEARMDMRARGIGEQMNFNARLRKLEESAAKQKEVCK